jgi:CxxC motif-containing protein (DUF1111 family)
MSARPSCAQLLVLAALLPVFIACARQLRPGDPLEGLTRDQKAQFERGRVVFDSAFTPETGVGPLFNAESCVACHGNPTSGGFGAQVEVHVGVLRSNGVCDPLVQQGGPVIQQRVTPALRSALGIDREPDPADADVLAQRTTPVAFGRGLLDAVPDSVILGLADPYDQDGDGISGRVNRFFDGRLGRFGRKALIPTLREFNDGAFVIEQGVTNPAVPNEETIGGRPIPEGVDPVPEPEIDQEASDLTDAFVRFLAPPAPLASTREGVRGRDLFSRIGCADCHVPTLRTGDSPIEALRHKDVAAYTDLLLHDMGPDLADDICVNLARPSEFRTEPLIGLRLVEQFLHDGRAKSLEQAIELHGGEAAGSRDRFLELSSDDRAALLAFLRSL